MEAVEVIKYITALGDTEWQVWQSDVLLATFYVESHALRYQSFLCSNLSADHAALETRCEKAEEEQTLLKQEGDWLREQLHVVQTEMDRARTARDKAENTLRELRDMVTGLAEKAKKTPPIPSLEEFGQLRDAAITAAEKVK